MYHKNLCLFLSFLTFSSGKSVVNQVEPYFTRKNYNPEPMVRSYIATPAYSGENNLIPAVIKLVENYDGGVNVVRRDVMIPSSEQLPPVETSQTSSSLLPLTRSPPSLATSRSSFSGNLDKERKSYVPLMYDHQIFPNIAELPLDNKNSGRVITSYDVPLGSVLGEKEEFIYQQKEKSALRQQPILNQSDKNIFEQKEESNFAQNSNQKSFLPSPRSQKVIQNTENVPLVTRSSFESTSSQSSSHTSSHFSRSSFVSSPTVIETRSAFVQNPIIKQVLSPSIQETKSSYSSGSHRSQSSQTKVIRTYPTVVQKVTYTVPLVENKIAKSEEQQTWPEVRRVWPETNRVWSETRQVWPEARQVIPERRQVISETKQIIPETRQVIYETKPVITEIKQVIPSNLQSSSTSSSGSFTTVYYASN